MSDARTIAAITGSRADFGLLSPVMQAIRAHPDLDLRVLIAGAHLLDPHPTAAEVRKSFDVAGEIPMQEPGPPTRPGDAMALGRGICGFAAWLGAHPVDAVVVLGDRVEAFAAAAAASVAGIRVAHLHGGDRAAGIADEAMRHAVTKLAHIHLPATRRSAERIIAMGEDPCRVHVVGSPAVDGLDEIAPLPDAAYDALGRPRILVLLHPEGRPDATERAGAECLLTVCAAAGSMLAMHPNHDPGREGIMAAIRGHTGAVGDAPHLARREFIGLLRRVEVLVGNSSAGLIECAALGVPAVNVGDRQAGRERPDNVIAVPDPVPDGGAALSAAVARALAEPPGPVGHPYGDPRHGGAAARTACVLASFDPDEHTLVKRNRY